MYLDTNESNHKDKTVIFFFLNEATESGKS